MATTAQINNFIKTISPIVQKVAKERGYKVASPIIAQACLESNYGLSKLSANYFNYFGLKCGSSWKGKSVNISTKEEYKAGVITNIKDNFRVYSSMEDGVNGYFDFISTKRYSNLKNASTANEYLTLIKQDGYATDSNYVNSNMKMVNLYDLTKYDNFNNIDTNTTINNTLKDNNTIAQEVIDDKWGTGTTRVNNLKNAGYDPVAIQTIVNQKLNNNATNKTTTNNNTNNNTFKVGDTIKIKKGAKYTNGKSIPNWVTNSVLYCRKIANNTVTFSTKKTGAITGVTNQSNVSKA